MTLGGGEGRITVGGGCKRDCGSEEERGTLFLGTVSELVVFHFTQNSLTSSIESPFLSYNNK